MRNSVALNGNGHMNGNGNGHSHQLPLGLKRPIDTLNLIGDPGAGKDTNMYGISADLKRNGVKVNHLVSGDMFRKLSEDQSEFAKRIKAITSSGKLIDDDTLFDIVNNHIDQNMEQDAFWIWNGVPRRASQVSHYLRVMEDHGREDAFLHLSLGDDQKTKEEEIIRRLMAGNRNRDDDKLETIKVRIEQAKPLGEVLEMMRERGRLITIDALKTADEVLASVRQNVGALLGETVQLEAAI